VPDTHPVADLLAALEDDPDAAATLRYDLHAILLGKPTIGAYNQTERAVTRMLLGPMTSEELTALIGAPTRD
jgi:hypothetical protein